MTTVSKGLSKRTIVNILLFIALLVLVYFIIYKPQQIFKPSSAMGASLFSMAAYEAEDILIEYQGKPDLRVQKINNQWQLTQPAKANIEHKRIKLLLTIMQEPIVASYPKKGADLASFGLDKPKGRLTINGELLEFGKTNPISLNRYLLKDGQVHTMNEIVYGVIGSALPQLLAHRLIADNHSLTEVKAPTQLEHISLATWQSLVANHITEGRQSKEASLGDLTLIAETARYHYEVLSVEPTLLLYRKDLDISYRLSLPK
ncbi:MAG: hypothetical protein KAH22_07155 [Thiotrichaceae bacterium]|nr:hypothetical protein [Thiotrichaceae bacterium]